MASTTTMAHIIPYLEIPRASGEVVGSSSTLANQLGMRGGGGSAHPRQFMLENEREREHGPPAWSGPVRLNGERRGGGSEIEEGDEQ
ncbi:hypothetical protein Sjap_018050 [Stephania japonica]|uniref:Uncharacterized protein n=1 Tax=Stephania japonica TaxID=461633 RepID=A0AAP0NL52_9MAGN